MRKINFNLSDRDKIQILKSTNIITMTALIITNVAGKVVLDAYEKNKKKQLLAVAMINRYAEIVPDEYNEQIYKEFAFQWVVMNLDLPSFPKEK